MIGRVVTRTLPLALAVCLVLGSAASVRAVLVLNETFANDSGFAKAEDDNTSAPFFTAGSGGADYWGINDPVGATDDYDGDTAPTTGVPAFSGFSGNFFNGEDIDQPGATHTIPLSLTWSNLDITGLTNLQFSGLFAAQDPGDFENTDYLKVQYRIDSDVAAYTDLLWFSADGDPGSNNDELAFDAAFDGVGEGTALVLAAQTFSASISGTGLTLDVRVLMASNDNNEAFAFDTLRVENIPEASSFLFGGLVCVLLGIRYGGKRWVGALLR